MMMLVKKEDIKKETKAIKLTYTEEMRYQDTRYKTENENLKRMKQLQEGIVEEAITKGYKGYAHTWEAGEEIITDIAENQKEFDKDSYTRHYGFCRVLIEELERMMNKRGNQE